jgi:hypothetical protein
MSVPGTAGAASPVMINEFMAKNTVGITNEFNEFADWIEILNISTITVNLNGWSLTDDATRPTKWLFPDTNIAPAQFIVVWASDKNRRIPGAPLHTNFKLSDEGEYLALIQSNGLIATEFLPKFPPQFPDITYGVVPGTETNDYLAWPTPGSANSPATNFVVADVNFAPAAGWYSNAIAVTISTVTPGVTIYYTTNGIAPSPTYGFVYSGPIPISGPTVLRAAAFKTGFAPTLPRIQTYLFLDQVVQQAGTGFPTNWGEAPAVYAFKSNVVNDPQWSALVKDGLLSIPTLSLAMDPADFFGTNGIYSNPLQEGEVWERPCAAQYMPLNGAKGFQINCGIRIQGFTSREPLATPKHSLRLLFKQLYGSGLLQYSLYPTSPVTEFDGLVLHASFNDHWVFSGDLAQMQRDRWCADTQQQMGGYGAHGVYVHLYINGLYWGLYDLGERTDASYAAHYLGGEKSDYDAFNDVEVIDGTADDWNATLAIAQAGITNDLAYAALGQNFEIPGFIDYMLMNFYAVNYDWPLSNWRLAGSLERGVKFRIYSWDSEWTFGIGGGAVNSDLTGTTVGTPGLLYTALRQNPEFRQLFGDHVQRHLFNDGLLTPSQCAARWQRRAEEIRRAIDSETARWGMDFMGNPYTQTNWLAEQSLLLSNWFPQRTAILLDQLRAAGLYPAVAAPTFDPPAGIFVAPERIRMDAPSGRIYYTTNGTDPRLPGGGVSPDAEMARPSGVRITTNTLFRARTFETNVWSALVEAAYLANPTTLRISRITVSRDGAVHLEFEAPTIETYSLEISSDLANWIKIANISVGENGLLEYLDRPPADTPFRYYRLVWP